MTIHEETMQALCVGSDYQRTLAEQAAADAQAIARDLRPLEERVEALRRQLVPLEQQAGDMRARLADRQREAAERAQLAEELRELAAQQCEANGWDLPDPGQPEAARGAARARQAVDALADPPFNVCVCPAVCPVHPGGPANGTGNGAAPTAEQPSAVPEPTADSEGTARASWSPRTLLLALYVRLQLAGGLPGRHRPLAHPEVSHG